MNLRMKKNFIYSALCLVLCLFTACSQDEIVSEGIGQSKVTLSVRVPNAGPTTRAASLDIKGYKMRCIMEMIDGNGAVVDGSRQVAGVTDGKATFTIDKTLAANGKCLFWADYVTEGAQDLEIDNIYKTTEGLTAVDYKLNKSNDLFNNNAVDAFCASIDVNNITATTGVTLKRPFTRLAVTKEVLNELDVNLNKIIVNLNVGSKYNVATGTTSIMKGMSNSRDTENEAIYIPIDVLTESNYAFYCYIFPGNDVINKVSSIAFQKDDDASTKKTLSITANQMKEIKPNHAITVKPNEGGDNNTFDVTITIDNAWEEEGNTPEPEPEPGTTLKVGDYIKADGTVTTTPSEAVAVVFAVGAGADDEVANYEGMDDKKIAGYAVSTKSVNNTRTLVFSSGADFTNITANDSQTAFTGFTNTAAFTGSTNFDRTKFPFIKALLTENNNVPAAPTANSSAWYVPSYAQALAFLSNYYGFDTTEAVASVKTAVDATLAEALAGKAFTDGSDETQNILTSTLNTDKDKFIAPQMKDTNSDNALEVTKATPAVSGKGSLYPVLTIFANATTN